MSSICINYGKDKKFLTEKIRFTHQHYFINISILMRRIFGLNHFPEKKNWIWLSLTASLHETKKLRYLFTCDWLNLQVTLLLHHNIAQYKFYCACEVAKKSQYVCRYIYCNDLKRSIKQNKNRWLRKVIYIIT